MGGVLERLFPAEERRPALWLVLAGLVPIAAERLSQAPWFEQRVFAWAFLGGDIQSTTLWAAAFVALGYVLLLTVSRLLRAPRAVAGFLLIASAASIGSVLLEAAALASRGAILGALGLPVPVQDYVPLIVQGSLPDLAGIVAVLLFALAKGTGAFSARRIAIGLGLDAEAPRVERRLAVAFAAVSFAVTVVGKPIELALEVMALRFQPPAPVTGAALYILTFGSMFLAVYLAIRRFRAPASSWMPFAAGATLLFASIPVYVLLPPPGISIAEVFASAPASLLYAFGAVASVLLAAFLATRGRGAPPSTESASIEGRSPSEEVMHG